MANKQHTPEEKAFNAAQCSICLLDWPMAQCLACKFHQPETEVEFNHKTMEMHTMDGWTPVISLQTRVSNLIAQIPQEYRARAIRECYGDNDFDFERNLTSYVTLKSWKSYEQNAQAAEITNDNNWLGSVFETLTKDNEKKQAKSFIELAKAHHERLEANKKVWVKPDNCQHEKARAIHSGMRCDECRETFAPRNEFEQSLVNEKNPRSSGYVNWKMR